MYKVESTRPALRPSKKNPHRKTEKITKYCDSVNQMIGVISSETIDATRIVITYMDEKELAEYSIRKKLEKNARPKRATRSVRTEKKKSK